MFKTYLAPTALAAAVALTQIPTQIAGADSATKTVGPEITLDERFGIHGADDAATADIHEAMARFAEAGLVLPALRIYVHDDPDACSGNLGLFNKGGDAHRIDLCDLRATIHEMAHAWEHHTLTDTDRQEFMNLQESDSWNDADTIYNHRGIEQIAFTITWGLDPNPIQAHLVDHHRADIDRYQTLTGHPTPRLHPGADTTLDTDTPDTDTIHEHDRQITITVTITADANFG